MVETAFLLISQLNARVKKKKKQKKHTYWAWDVIAEEEYLVHQLGKFILVMSLKPRNDCFPTLMGQKAFSVSLVGKKVTG